MSLEYIDEQHIYVLDGRIIPSVSEIINIVLDNPYENIPSYILENAAEYGTEIHLILQEYEEGKNRDFYTIMQEITLDEYKRIKQEEEFEVIDQEKMIHYQNLYAGRYDILAKNKNGTILIDIKTTAELDIKRLELQLSLYNKVVKAERLACIWLPKDKPAKLVNINEIETDTILEKYKEIKENLNE